MKRLLTITLVIGKLCVTTAQFGDTLWLSSDKITLLDTIVTDAHLLTTDPLQNYFLANTSPEISKYDREGNFLFRYSNNRYGPLSWIDAPNPFNIQLFFKEFQRLVILDNTLSEIKSYALQDWGYYESSAVTFSLDKNLWIFDAISGELRKLDQNGNILFASDNLFYELETDPEPLRLVESKSFIVLLDKNQGFFLFDIFGKYIGQLDIAPTTKFQLRRELLFYEADGLLHIYNLKTRGLSVIMVKEKLRDYSQEDEDPIRDIRIEADVMYVLEENLLEVFKISTDKKSE